MLYLVLGGSASGKSAFAEQLTQQLYEEEQKKGRKIYLATMKPNDKEVEERIRKHRQNRKEGHFVTKEEYGLLSEPDWVEQEDIVLLECLSNYLNNVYMEEPEQVAETLLQLHKRCRHLVVVSNMLQSDGITYDTFTQAYLDKFERIQARLAKEAKQVYEVVCGIPVLWK